MSQSSLVISPQQVSKEFYRGKNHVSMYLQIFTYSMKIIKYPLRRNTSHDYYGA